MNHKLTTNNEKTDIKIGWKVRDQVFSLEEIFKLTFYLEVISFLPIVYIKRSLLLQKANFSFQLRINSVIMLIKIISFHLFKNNKKSPKSMENLQTEIR